MDKGFEKLFYQKLRTKKYRLVLSMVCSMFRSLLVLLPTLLMREVYNAIDLGRQGSELIGVILLTLAVPIVVGITFSVDIRLSKYFFQIIKEIRVVALSNLLHTKLSNV